MGLILTIVLIAVLVLSSSFFMRFAKREGYDAATTSTTSSSSGATKGLPMGSWGWNPKADANYAKKQEQQCAAGGGKITKYSDAFYMCNGAKWT